MLSYKPNHKHLIINNTQGDIGYKGFRLARNKSVLVEEITPVIQELIDNNSVSAIDHEPEAEQAPVEVETVAEAPEPVEEEAPKAEPIKEEAPKVEKPVTTNVKADAPKPEQKDNRK